MTAETQRRRRGHGFYPPAPIPGLYDTEGTPVDRKMLHAHYFVGGCDWWVTEYEPATGVAFGYTCLADPDMAEWGYFDLTELEGIVTAGGFVVERDLHWRPTPVADVALPGRHGPPR